MRNEKTKSISQLEREKAAFLYTSALERGDFETVELILVQAQEDTVLERILLELNEVLAHECVSAIPVDTAFAEDVARVERIVREYLPSGLIDTEGEAE